MEVMSATLVHDGAGSLSVSELTLPADESVHAYCGELLRAAAVTVRHTAVAAILGDHAVAANTVIVPDVVEDVAVVAQVSATQEGGQTVRLLFGTAVPPDVSAVVLALAVSDVLESVGHAVVVSSMRQG